MDQPAYNLPVDIINEVFFQLEAGTFGFKFYLTHKNAKDLMKHFGTLTFTRSINPVTAAVLALCNPRSFHPDSLAGPPWWQGYNRVENFSVIHVTSKTLFTEALEPGLGLRLRLRALRFARSASVDLNLFELIQQVGKSCPNLLALTLESRMYSLTSPSPKDRLADLGPLFPSLLYLSLPSLAESLARNQMEDLKSFPKLELIAFSDGNDSRLLTTSPVRYSIHIQYNSWRKVTSYETPLTYCVSFHVAQAQAERVFAQWRHLLYGFTIPQHVQPYITPSRWYTPLLQGYSSRFIHGQLHLHLNRMKFFISNGCNLFERWSLEDLTLPTFLAGFRSSFADMSHLLDLIDYQLAIDPKSAEMLPDGLIGGCQRHSLLMKLVGFLNTTPAMIDKVVLQYKVDVNLLDKMNATALHYATTPMAVRRLLHHGARVDLGRPLVGQLSTSCGQHPDCTVMAVVEQHPELCTAKAMHHLLANYTKLPELTQLLEKHFSAAELAKLLRETLVQAAFKELPQLYPKSLFGRPEVISNLVDDNGDNILSKATGSNSIRWVENLLYLGASLTESNLKGVSPIGHWLQSQDSLAMHCLKSWKQYKLELTAISTQGDTLLMAAARGLHFKACEKIIRLWTQAHKDDVTRLLYHRNAAGKDVFDLVAPIQEQSTKRQKKVYFVFEALKTKFPKPPE